jgi:hypothetical protein
LKKINSQIIGRPKDGDFSMGEMDMYFITTLYKFLNETISNSKDKLISKSSGMLSIEIVFLKTPPKFLIANFSSFGFSVTELQTVITEMKNQIVKY